MTSLQLAFEFQKTYPGIVRLLGFEAGGTEVRDQNSLAHYLANELFTRISTGRITEVEGASLSSAFLNQLSYQHQGTPFDSSVKLGSYDLALFRLK